MRKYYLHSFYTYLIRRTFCSPIALRTQAVDLSFGSSARQAFRGWSERAQVVATHFPFWVMLFSTIERLGSASSLTHLSSLTEAVGISAEVFLGKAVCRCWFFCLSLPVRLPKRFSFCTSNAYIMTSFDPTIFSDISILLLCMFGWL